METARTLLSVLTARKVRIWAEGGKLRLRGPAGSLPPDELEQLRTLKDDLVKLLGEASDSPAAEIRPRKPAAPVPLTPGLQRAFRHIFERHGGMSTRSCAIVTRVSGPLKTHTLQECIRTVVKRHESLRTRFVASVDGPLQEIDEYAPCDLKTIRLPGVSSQAIDQEAARLAKVFVEEPVHLSAGPLFAGRLYRFSQQEHVLILAVDHMISDGESLALLHQEIWTAYRQSASGVPIALPELPVQFADYAVWLAATHEPWLRNHASYWRRRLEGAPRTKIPSNDTVPPTEESMATRLEFPFGRPFFAMLRKVAQREGTQTSLVVLATYVAAISRWCDESDIVLTFAIHARHAPELTNMIGCVTAALFLRIAVAPDDSFRSLLHKIVQEYSRALEHFDHNRVPDLLPECGTDLFFNYIPSHTRNLSFEFASGQEDVKVMAYQFRKPLPFTLACFFVEDPETGISCRVEYRPDSLSESTVRSFCRRLQRLAGEFAEKPLACIDRIPAAI